MEGNPSTRAHILLVESDAPQAEHFMSLLASTGHQVTVASSGSEALESISSHAFDILLLDLSLDDMDGVRVLCRAKEARPESLVFILTGAPSIETAVEALRRGAYDYLLKPIQDDDLLHLVEKALRIRQLGEVRRRAAEDLESEKVRNIELRRDLQIRYSFSSILGKSPKMKQIHDLVLEVTRSDSTV